MEFARTTAFGGNWPFGFQGLLRPPLFLVCRGLVREQDRKLIQVLLIQNKAPKTLAVSAARFPQSLLDQNETTRSSPSGERPGHRSTESGLEPANPGAQVGSGASPGGDAGLPAAKWSGVDFLPAVSRLFTFSGVTSLLTRSTSPLRHASNSSRAAGSTASAAAPAQAAPPPAQRRPDMILAAAASSSASNGSRSPGPASRRARPPGGDALRAQAAPLPAVTGIGAAPWPRHRAPLARPRDPRLPLGGGGSANQTFETRGDAAAEAGKTPPASSSESWERK